MFWCKFIIVVRERINFKSLKFGFSSGRQTASDPKERVKLYFVNI
jgi:hypothetical protein